MHLDDAAMNVLWEMCNLMSGVRNELIAIRQLSETRTRMMQQPIPNCAWDPAKYKVVQDLIIDLNREVMGWTNYGLISAPLISALKERSFTTLAVRT